MSGSRICHLKIHHFGNKDYVELKATEKQIPGKLTALLLFT